MSNKKLVILGLLIIVLAAGWLGRAESRLSQKNVLSAQTNLATTPIPSPSISCSYFQASWIQFKRDFIETQSKNYSNPDSATKDLNRFFQLSQKQAQISGCNLNF